MAKHSRRAATSSTSTRSSTRLAETKQEAFNLRFQHATGQLDNTARLAEVRRQIARINTVAAPSARSPPPKPET